MSSLPSSQFLFQAMTPAGAKTIGVRPAASESQLADELRRDQLLLLRAWRLPLGGVGPQRLHLGDEAALYDQLSVLLSRGVPLVEALEVASSVVRAEARGKVLRLRELVAAGSSFAEACHKVGCFDAVTIAVYRSAERTGDVAGAARRLAVSAKRRLAIRGKAVTVMIYPTVVCTVSLLMFLGILIFLVPMIARQLRQMKTTTNAYSQMVFSTGEWLSAHMGLASGMLLLVVLGLLMIRRRLGAWALRVLRGAPAVARLLLTVEMARFFSVMGAMVKSGVPLADAMATATVVISDARLRRQLEVLQKSLVEGGLWRVLVERADALPLATRRLLIAAERAGDLDSALDSLALDMSDEVDVRAARLLAVLEPAAILLMFMLIGPLIFAIAIPLFSARIGGQ